MLLIIIACPSSPSPGVAGGHAVPRRGVAPAEARVRRGLRRAEGEVRGEGEDLARGPYQPLSVSLATFPFR